MANKFVTRPLHDKSIWEILFTVKCTWSIVKTWLVGLLAAMETGDEKHNITKSFRIQSSTPLGIWVKTGSSLEHLSDSNSKNHPVEVCDYLDILGYQNIINLE